MSRLEKEDFALCANEVAKLIAVLRTTERYADITKPSILWAREVLAHTDVSDKSSTEGTAPKSSASSSPLGSFVMPSAEAATSINAVAQLLELQQLLSSSQHVEVLQVLTPFMHVVVDPSLSGYVTGAALSGTMQILEFGSRLSFLKNFQIAGGVIDCVAKTKFTETHRDHDETVLLRIIAIIEFVLTQGCVDKSRIAAGLQCIQTIWIEDSFGAALKDSARSAVFKILLHVMQLADGCDGYADTLRENVCLNLELLVKQAPNAFDVEKLGFFIDVLARLSFSSAVPFQIMHALHHLLPAGPAAMAIDSCSSSSSGILSRNSQALPLAASLLSVGNSILRTSESALVLEALLSSMYCRFLTPLGSAESLKLAGLGEVALELLTSQKKNLPNTPYGYISLVQSGAIANQLSPHSQQCQALVLEALAQIVREPDFIARVWENFDCVWHRSELATQLIDGIVNAALSNKVIALLSSGESPSDRERVKEALSSFFALATSPESLIDPDAIVPSYIECLAVDVLKQLVVSLHGTAQLSGEKTEETSVGRQQFLTRRGAKEAASKIKAKPKKTGEIILKFISDFHPQVDFSTQEQKIAWALHVMPGIDFDALGEFFGQPGETASLSMSAFIRSLDLSRMDPEEALRACLQSFRLPGEAQQIDRIVKEIAYEFCKAHEGVAGKHYFASPDAAYTFLFSVIMLNTDQHNPQVKKRMELRDFIRNNRKINDGEDIPEEVQTRVFNSIRNAQIVTPKSGSFFCAPLKGRWKDLWHLHESGLVPDHIVPVKSSHSVHKLLAAKGYDMMLAAAYVLARDPKRYTRSVEVVAGLADLSLSCTLDPMVTNLGSDCIWVLKKYALKAFSSSGTPRSFACLSALLKLDVGARSDPLLEAVSAMLCYWAPYEASLLLKDGEEESFMNLKTCWAKVLVVPLLEPAAEESNTGAISSLFRGFLNPLLDQDFDEAQHKSPVVEEVLAEGETPDWRKEAVRYNSSPSMEHLMALKGVEVEKFLNLTLQNASKVSAIVLMMLDLIAASGKATTQDFWQKELVRSSPWALLLAARLLTACKHSDLLAASAARDAVIVILRHYSSGQLADIGGLKIAVFVSFFLVTFFAQKDENSNVVDPSWILPVLDEINSLAHEKTSILQALGPMIAAAIKTMLAEAPVEYISRLGAPVWRECVKVLAAVCRKQTSGGKNFFCHESALELILNQHVLASFAQAANGANDMTECVVAYEQILGCNASQKIVSKTLAEIACQLAALGEELPGAGLAWTAVVSRVNLRVTSAVKQKKCTPIELSDSVELLRICLGHPRASQILSPSQVGATIEKCASTLSAVVSAVQTPGGALQAALSVFARFFLACLEKLQKHPQFDHLWLMSLRVILLFIKRGHDEPSLEQLAEITTETLRNALQVLLAANLLQLPVAETEVVWWKVTWEIVETFCPGIWTELRDHLQDEPVVISS